MFSSKAANTAATKDQWTQQADIDAWLIQNTCQVANPGLSPMTRMDEPFFICRDTGVVLTAHGKDRPQAKAFVEIFFSSLQGKKYSRNEVALCVESDPTRWYGMASQRERH